MTLEWPLLLRQQGCEARRASGDTSTVYVAVKECTNSNAARRVRSTTRSGAALPCILGNTPMFEAQPAGEHCDPMCGCVAVWLCGCVAVWMCGCVGLWWWY